MSQTIPNTFRVFRAFRGRIKSSFCILPIFFVVGFLFAGCETNSDATYGELPVSPSSTTLEGREKSVLLTADISYHERNPDTIIYPLEWTVDHPDTGRITAQSANSATYTHTSRSTGANTITVRDQTGRRGIALVTWLSAE